MSFHKEVYKKRKYLPFVQTSLINDFNNVSRPLCYVRTAFSFSIFCKDTNGFDKNNAMANFIFYQTSR